MTVLDWNALSRESRTGSSRTGSTSPPTGAQAMATMSTTRSSRSASPPRRTALARQLVDRRAARCPRACRDARTRPGSAGRGRHGAVPLDSDRRRAPARCSARVDGRLTGVPARSGRLHASRAGRRPRRRLAYACRDGPDRVASAAPAQAKEVQVTLNAFQRELCESSPYDFTGLRALYVNCTLKRSPEVSNTQGLIDVSVAIMEANGVAVDQFRAVDHDLAPGVYPDMREHGAATRRVARPLRARAGRRRPRAVHADLARREVLRLHADDRAPLRQLVASSTSTGSTRTTARSAAAS